MRPPSGSTEEDKEAVAQRYEEVINKQLLRSGVMTKEELQPEIASFMPLVEKTWFNVVIGLLVITNTILIGLTVDGVDRGREDAFFALNQIFTFIFFVELLMRLKTHGRAYFKSKLNVVDCALVVMMIIDNWVLELVGKAGALKQLSALRILRIVRLVRLIRLLKLFKELWVIVQSFVKSIQALSWVAVVVLVSVYVFSLVATLVFKDLDNLENLDGSPFNKEEYIGKVWKSCVSFFQIAVGRSGDSYNHIIRPILSGSPWSLLFFLAFTGLVRFGVLNMVVGIICENTFDVAKAREAAIRVQKEREERKLLMSLRDFFVEMDADGSGELTRDEMRVAFGTPAIFRAFQLLKLPIIEPDQLFNLMDADNSGAVSFAEFIQGIAKLKKEANGKDVLMISMQVRNQDLNVIDYSRRLDALGNNVVNLTARVQRVFQELKEYAEKCPDPVVRKRRQGEVFGYVTRPPPRGARSNYQGSVGSRLQGDEHVWH